MTLQIKHILNTFEGVAPWTDGPYDDEKNHTLLQAAKALSKFPLQDVHNAILVYEHHHRLSENATQALSKLYLLFRVFFIVPEAISRAEAKVFGGWNHPSIGRPDESTFQLSWAVQLNAEGQPEVRGLYKSYRGRPYDAVGEFEHFAKNFGRRF
jgi:hypothetical protein